MLGLKARQTAVREIADGAVFETRLFADVKSGKVDGRLLASLPFFDTFGSMAKRTTPSGASLPVICL